MKKLINVRYSKAILPFLILSIFLIFLLFYYSNISRKIEKENYQLIKSISLLNDQVSVNEIEYSLYSNYDYLLKMQNIYFEKNQNENFSRRLSFKNFKNKNIKEYHNVGLKISD